MTDIISKKLKTLQEVKKSSKFWNITWEQGVFLSNLIEIKKPKAVLEIGTSNGFSTLWLAKSLSQKSFIDTIEVDKYRYDLANENFKDCSLSNINSYFGHVFDVLPKLKSKKFDVIFVDAAHQFYLDLIKMIEKFNMLNKDFTLIFDNVATHKQLKEFTEYIYKNYACEFVEIGGGFLLAKAK